MNGGKPRAFPGSGMGAGDSDEWRRDTGMLLGGGVDLGGGINGGGGRRFGFPRDNMDGSKVGSLPVGGVKG